MGEYEERTAAMQVPDVAEWIVKYPNLRLDDQGRVGMRDMQADEISVILDGVWIPGATLTSAKGGAPHVTPVQPSRFSIR